MMLIFIEYNTARHNPLSHYKLAADRRVLKARYKMTTRKPTPAYQDTGVLYGDKELYARIGKIAEAEGGKTLIEDFEIPIRSGKAWVVKKGMFLGKF